MCVEEVRKTWFGSFKNYDSRDTLYFPCNRTMYLSFRFWGCYKSRSAYSIGRNSFAIARDKSLLTPEILERGRDVSLRGLRPTSLHSSRTLFPLTIYSRCSRKTSCSCDWKVRRDDGYRQIFNGAGLLWGSKVVSEAPHRAVGEPFGTWLLRIFCKRLLRSPII